MARRMLINHLTAAADYNGKECEVVGCDPFSPTDLYGKRVHVHVIDPDTGKPTGPAVKLRRQNLVPLGNPNPEVHDRETPRPPWSSKTRMSDEQTLKLLKESFQRALSQGCAECASGERQRNSCTVLPHAVSEEASGCRCCSTTRHAAPAV